MYTANTALAATNTVIIVSVIICGIVIIFSTFQILGLKKILSFLKKYWFLILFPLCGSVLGFIIDNDKIGGKLIVAVLFAAVALLIAWILFSILSALQERLNSKSGNIIITLTELILCVLLFVFAITRTYGKYHNPLDKYKSNNYKSKSEKYGLSDYIKDNDPELYDSIKERYDSIK